jgi:diguanylate cyclase (GGDEF)-like protein
MSTSPSANGRLSRSRAAVWIAALAVCLLYSRADYPSAWKAALFGAAFAALIPCFRVSGRRRLLRDPEAGSGAIPERASVRRARAIVHVGVDVATVTLLVHISGGFGSIYSPLYFLAVLEAFALLDASGAIYTGLACGLLSLLHLRISGMGVAAAVIFGVAIGILLLCAMVGVVAHLVRERLAAGDRVEAEDPESDDAMPEPRVVAVAEPDEAPAAPGSGLAASLLEKLRRRRRESIEAIRLEKQRVEQANEQLKSTYRELAQVTRAQKVQIEQLRLGVSLVELGASITHEEFAATGYGRLLRAVMTGLEAGGGVLWLADAQGECMQVACVEGRVAPMIRAEAVPATESAGPGAVRQACEERLLVASPASAVASFESRVDADAEGAKPVLAALIRRSDPSGASLVVGAVGLCDPRGSARFNQNDQERLNGISGAIYAAITEIDNRERLERELRERSALYDLQQLVQTTPHLDALYAAVLDTVVAAVPAENCTLFLLDAGKTRLEPRATIGRTVNLLEHFSFERGQGISGWVASRRRQILIPDLAKEPNLENVEQLPARVRSFAAIPMIVHDSVIGVLTLADPRPEAFTADDAQLLSALASHAASTIERTEEFHTLERLAVTDGLTGLTNYRFFEMRLDEEMRRSRRYGLPLALMLVDIDHFKQVNDLFGHPSGDRVLRDLARLMRETVRETEIVARYGGEEFALILPQTGVEQALIAAERVRATIAAYTFATSDRQRLRLTVSIGVAGWPALPETSEELVEAADRALYVAKADGRDCVRAATPHPHMVAVAGAARRAVSA